MESSVLCDRTGALFRGPQSRRRSARNILARVVSVAIGATILPVIGSPIIARAATIEEVARCRAIQINRERWDCFKALKAPKRNYAKEKRDDTPPSQTEDIPKPKPEDVPKTKSEDVPPAALHGAQEPASDDPASTSSIDHPSVVPGQLVCANQDSLVAAFVAGVVLGASPAQLTKYGCQTIPKDAQVEILERFPSTVRARRKGECNLSPTAEFAGRLHIRD